MPPLSLALSLLVSGSVLVDMVVASVDGIPITLSELIAETRLVLLRTRDAQIAESAALTPPLMNAVLLSIVHRELLLAEVRRLQLREVPDQDVERSFAPIARRFPSGAALNDFLERSGFEVGTVGAVPVGVAAILRNELEVERFLDVRVRLGIKLDPTRLLACYEANRAHFQSRPFAEVETRIRERLRAEAEEAAVAQLLAQLKSRSVITYAAGYEPGPTEPEEPPLGFRCPPAPERVAAP